MLSRPTLSLVLAALSTLLGACSGNVQVSSGGTGGAGTTTATTSGGAGSSAGGGSPGDCQVPADCGGGQCAPLTPGGYNVCLQFPKEAPGCNPGGNPPDECCTSSDCAQGKCYLSTEVPLCGGVQPYYNECVTDQCQSDADCNLGVPALCVPAGAYGPMRRCVVAYCKTNADCDAEPGGTCAPIENPCCPVPLAVACVYPGGCQKQADCGSDFTKRCDIDPATKRAVCLDGGVGCPE